MINELACQLGRNDEMPNIALAEKIVANKDKESIQELVMLLKEKDKAVANDCIKVLYEIGERKPELIRNHAEDFITLLLSNNNRLVWGAMTALAQIAELESRTIFDHLEVVKAAYENGSVITRDQSITVFAKLCKQDMAYEKEILPFLINHISHCRPKEVAQHAERMLCCINPQNKEIFYNALLERKPILSDAQCKRVDQLMKKIK